MASKRVAVPGAPRYSDVCFSSRWKHPANAADTLQTFPVAAAFHASRLDWVYNDDKTWIQEVKKRGYQYGGTVNANLPDTKGGQTLGRILDSGGARLTAPWMEGWGVFWGCVNSDDYRATYLAHTKRLIDAGADFIQVDDPRMNMAAMAWGGCYCSFCKSKAAASGATVKDIQKASVEDFFKDMGKQLDAYAGHHVPFSSNNYNSDWTSPYHLFDFGMAELPVKEANPQIIYAKFKATEKLGKAQVFTFVSEDVNFTRRVIATSYASGGHLIVPWDVYLKSTPTGSVRYYGRPEEYADLYGFVRGNAALMDGYEDAAVSGKNLTDSRYSKPFVTITGGSEEVYAFIRTIPEKTNQAIALHLVEWGTHAEPFSVSLDMSGMGIDKDWEFTLLLPDAYSKNKHDQAEATGDYARLIKSTSLKPQIQDNRVILEIPALSPYAIIKIKKQ
ncbi:hypothetical protein [Dyadobacter helix]|nr:hypothetical protein [Dyadobacter sp. CECT 9275]